MQQIPITGLGRDLVKVTIPVKIYSEAQGSRRSDLRKTSRPILIFGMYNLVVDKTPITSEDSNLQYWSRKTPMVLSNGKIS